MEATLYITTHVASVFPIVATRPQDYKFLRYASRVPDAAIEAPEYPTEMDVTRAIAAGTFKGFASSAYAAAKAYQIKLIASRRRMH